MTTKTKIYNSTIRDARAHIKNSREFNAGGRFYDIPNFRGRKSPQLFDVPFGQLAAKHIPDLRQALINREVEYIVFSYLTPIAWKINGEWVMVEEEFSRSTSHHQHAVRLAI